MEINIRILNILVIGTVLFVYCYNPCNICIFIFHRATEKEKQLNEIITEKHYLIASSSSLAPIIENITKIALIATLVQTVISISTSYYSFFHLD